MGCVASRIDKQEKVRICKERKRLIKELLGYRKEFADAQLSYLRSLRNAGVTLRQFTDSESLEFEETTSALGFPPSPPPPLPPSPPPPPSFSPDSRRFSAPKPPPPPPIRGQPSMEDVIEVNEDGGQTPPPPLPPSSTWEYWDPFSSSLQQGERSDSSSSSNEITDEENWEDTNTEFLEVDDDDDDDDVNMSEENGRVVEFVDEGILSAMRCEAKDNNASSSDMAVVVWKCRNLASIVKELDEYFLKASDVLKDVVVMVDVDAKGTFHYQNIYEHNRKRGNSSKVFSALTWSWSSKSLQYGKEMGGDLRGSDEPCKPGAHGITLRNLYLEEKKLYKDVKEEESSKLEYARKTLLLRRHEEDHDSAKTEKTRLAVETLESHISSLQASISKSYSNILNLIDKELHPQIITLASGLLHMWQTMHRCHQFQKDASEQLKNLTDQQSFEPTTEYRRQAALQLQTEVSSWHRSFCKLVKFQRDYVRVISKWIELNTLKDIDPLQVSSPLTLHALTQKWLLALDNLPDKMVSDAIKHLLSAVQAIVLQQQEECNVRKRSEKLGRRLERETSALSEAEMRYDAKVASLGNADSQSSSSKHPLMIRRAKVEALRKLVNDEKAKYVSSIKTTKVLILNNLQSSLPKVFQALVAYSSAYSNSFEIIVGSVMKAEDDDVVRT